MSDYILPIYFMIRTFFFPSQRTQSVSLQRPCLPAYEPWVISLSWISLTSIQNIEAVDSSERLVGTRKASCCLKRDGCRSGTLPHCRITSDNSYLCFIMNRLASLTLYLPTWRIWWAPNNASKGQMGFNLAFKGLITYQKQTVLQVSQSAIWELRSSGLLLSE
jgi:hypothetical protein